MGDLSQLSQKQTFAKLKQFFLGNLLKGVPLDKIKGISVIFPGRCLISLEGRSEGEVEMVSAVAKNGYILLTHQLTGIYLPCDVVKHKQFGEFREDIFKRLGFTIPLSDELEEDVRKVLSEEDEET